MTELPHTLYPDTPIVSILSLPISFFLSPSPSPPAAPLPPCSFPPSFLSNYLLINVSKPFESQLQTFCLIIPKHLSVS